MLAIRAERFVLAPSLTLHRPSTRTLAMLALVGANVIWGASIVATKPVLAHVPPLTLACARFAVALAVLGPLVARAGARPATGRAPLVLGLTGVLRFCLCQNVGLRYASATNAALIQGGIPVLTALLAAVILGERLGGRRLAGTLASLTGVAAIVLLGGGAGLGASLGNLLPLAGALSFALYTVLGRRAFVTGDALALLAGGTRYALLGLLPAAVVEVAVVGVAVPAAGDLLLLLYLGAGCSALAFVLAAYGLRHLEAGQVAGFGNLKPLVGVGLAAILLRGPIPPVHVVSGALILAGVWLSTARGDERGSKRWQSARASREAS